MNIEFVYSRNVRASFRNAIFRVKFTRLINEATKNFTFNKLWSDFRPKMAKFVIVDSKYFILFYCVWLRNTKENVFIFNYSLDYWKCLPHIAAQLIYRCKARLIINYPFLMVVWYVYQNQNKRKTVLGFCRLTHNEKCHVALFSFCNYCNFVNSQSK